MTLAQHLALTGVAAAALTPVMGVGGIALFAVGSVLIDVDHYLLYIQRRKSFSVVGMFRYFHELQPIQSSIPYVGLCIFHTIDFFILIGVLAIYYPIFFPLLVGLLYHFCLDLYDLKGKCILTIRPFFLMEHLIRRRSKGYPWY